MSTCRCWARTQQRSPSLSTAAVVPVVVLGVLVLVVLVNALAKRAKETSRSTAASGQGARSGLALLSASLPRPKAMEGVQLATTTSCSTLKAGITALF